jgi:hypothetical protein
MVMAVKPTNFTELNPGKDMLASGNGRTAAAYVMHSNP